MNSHYSVMLRRLSNKSSFTGHIIPKKKKKRHKNLVLCPIKITRYLHKSSQLYSRSF
jgi:hypothetical protein